MGPKPVDRACRPCCPDIGELRVRLIKARSDQRSETRSSAMPSSSLGGIPFARPSTFDLMHLRPGSGSAVYDRSELGRGGIGGRTALVVERAKPANERGSA